MDGRIAITGVGAVSPAGIGAGAFWKGLLAPDDRRSRWSREDLSRYPGMAVVEIPRGVLDAIGVHDGGHDGGHGGTLAHRLVRHGVEQALCAAGLDAGRGAGRVGCFLATTTAGVDAFSDAITGRAEPGPALDPAGILAAPGQDWRGPAAVLSTACSSGLIAPALAADAIAGGEAEAMVAGGVDVLLEYTLCGFAGLRLATDDRCRPFSRERRGVVLSEGMACVCLEPLAAALERRADVLAVILGYALNCDAGHMTAPDPDGVGRAMAEALDTAGVDRRAVGGVFAHGTGTQANDVAEAEALRRAFGAAGVPPVTAVKSTMGHPQAAAGAFSLLAAVAALRDGVLPPTSGFQEPDPALAGIDVVAGRPRPLVSRCVMVDAFGFGGNNGVMVVADLATAQRGRHGH